MRYDELKKTQPPLFFGEGQSDTILTTRNEFHYKNLKIKDRLITI